MAEDNNIYSKKIRAGRRTYFVDVKRMDGGDFYTVFSESRRNFDENNSVSYQKSKIFVYPEDISRFVQSVNDAFEEIKRLMPDYDFEKFERRDMERGEERPAS